METILDLWYVWAIAAVIVGNIAAKAWTYIFRIDEEKVVRAAWKGVVSFNGKTLLQFGGIAIAISMVPWESFNIPETFVLIGSVLFVAIIGRFDNLISALLNLPLVRIGQRLEHNGVLFEVTDKTWSRVLGKTEDGEFYSVSHTDLYSGGLKNWSSVPFARGWVEVHVDQSPFDLAVVRKTIEKAIRFPDGQVRPEYSVLEDEGDDSAIGVEKRAFVIYAGQEPNSHLLKVAFYSRWRADIPGLQAKLSEEIWHECNKNGISLGQTANLGGTLIVK